MPALQAEEVGKIQHGRKEHGRSSPAKAARASSPQKPKQKSSAPMREESNTPSGYRLGDSLGKGAFGSVFRGLNLETGETVAIKQIKLADIPNSELRVIMMEIDLLKELHHPNIVKYQGFVKTPESLCIVLEYCENGSLHSICKNFGKFPENLVALYMAQVLHGLIYLHEQGVIHRDIKGANILTTKEGLVKLADFGVATKVTGPSEASVVGTPYWMAPEVVELSGATTASDIWSLGCTVIELLDGKPPFHKLDPMPALFRIVNDDHPPLPESISSTVQDFLMQCFQKDPNLRVSARKLLKHPWISSVKRNDLVVPIKPTKYDEAVKSVQQWNEALKSPENTIQRGMREGSASPNAISTRLSTPTLPPVKTAPDLLKERPDTERFRSPDNEEHDIWDDDFESSIDSNNLQLPHFRPVDNFAGMLSPDKLKAYATVDAPFNGTKDEAPDDPFASKRSASERSDPLETVRPRSPKKTRHTPQTQGHPVKVSQRLSSQPKTQIFTPQPSTAGASKPPKRTSSMFRESSVEDFADLLPKSNDAVGLKFQENLKPKRTKGRKAGVDYVPQNKESTHHASPRSGSTSNHTARRFPESDQELMLRRTRSSVEMAKFAEKEQDEDFSDIFGDDASPLAKRGSDSGSERVMLSVLNSRLSSNSWLGDEEDEDDPFAQLEEDLDQMDIETKVARDKHVRLCSLVESLVGSLKTTQNDEMLADLADELLQVLFDTPDLKSVVISSHGLLPILEVLENCRRRDISLQLLKIINIIILDSVEIQENFCFVGGIPIVTKYAHKKYPRDIRLEAAAFVRQMYQTSTLTLQMFISCGGLNVLVEFLEENYEAERDLVLIGVTGVWSVFELQGPTPKNDFCRIFSRSAVLYPLSLVLNRVLSEKGQLAELVEGRIVNIFLLFSQAENHVKESVANRIVLKRILKDLPSMSPNHLITMLKFVKNLSMLSTTLDALQNSNAIEALIDLLDWAMTEKLPHLRDVSNHVLNTMFNLCRLSKARQEDAALNGVIPLLMRVVKTERPLKEFALPVLCDMAHAGKVGRQMLWQHKGLSFYTSLLADQYWQVTALDAIFIWLQEETAKVEDSLLADNTFSKSVVDCFVHSRVDAFESLLEPLQKLLRLSPPLAATLCHPVLFSCFSSKLHNKKAVVRVNLLRVIKSICDSSEEQGHLIRRYGIQDAIAKLAENDPAILVRNMASDLVRASDSSDVSAFDSGRYGHPRRTSSSTATPPSLYSTSSQPPTPSHRGTPNTSYFDVTTDYPAVRRRTSNMSLTDQAYRPVSREGRGPIKGTSGLNGNLPNSTSAVKSRLPRTNLAKPLKSSAGPRKDEHHLTSTPAASTASPTPKSSILSNSRRRRQTSNG
ncbi:MAG: hypothetical protein M1828_007179 [Chrysothrix sp. TS-e1954]|nr:MAG: hypothetical protein M1828_007179 [Chrysothrix sp. TS-e1954]